MSTVRISLEQFSGSLKRARRAIRAAVVRGIQEGAERSKEVLTAKTPVDTGELLEGWEVRKTHDGIELINEAPHAGIVERGAGPHPVSEEGQKKLAAWAMRKLNVSPEEAKRVAFLIARKIASEGQKPTYFVFVSIDEITEELKKTVESELQKVSGTV